MRFGTRAGLLAGTAALVALSPLMAFAQDGGATALEEIEVIGTSPLGGDDLALDKVPASVRSVKAQDFRDANAPTVQEGLGRSVPGVNITDVTGNPFNKEVFFRGFQSSPTVGIPQGLAVYQNGVRINESLGDTVNYDLIPTVAIDRLDVWTNNPLFGLNALGGALSFKTKSGFTFQGVELEAQAGSFGRYEGSAQWGTQVGNWAGYIAIEGARDGGWRDYSKSNVKRVFGDVGYKTDSAEVHFNLTYAKSTLGVVGPTPEVLLNDRRRNVYTGDQINDNEMGMLAMQGNFDVTDKWSLQTNAYYRKFNRDGVDGNDTDVRPCGTDGQWLCLDGDDDVRNFVRDPVTGKRIRNTYFPTDGEFGPGTTPGSIERNSVRTDSAGGTLQATNESELFGRKNHFVAGVAYDFGRTDFKGWSELCRIPANLQCVGTGQQYYTEVPGGITPVSITGTNNYVGLYAIDTLDLTERLSATIGGRWNYANIDIKDKSTRFPLNEDRTGRAGPSLDGNHSFDRFNPMAGLTYKITPNITAFGSYSESNRNPTVLELGCANPDVPCPLEATLVSDPPLKQVVTRGGEAGFRGQHEFSGAALRWSATIYRSENQDDIINVPSNLAGRGYFVNAGDSRRQGVELSAEVSAERWAFFANYAYVDATFRKGVTLNSPNNPASKNYGQDDDDDDRRAAARADKLKTGQIRVQKGDTLPGIPAHQVKFGGAFKITPRWTVGADAQIYGSQYYVGDESNQNPKLPAYAVFNANTSFQVTEQVKLFAGAKNIFNKKYNSYGTFFETDDIGFLGLENPRTQTPARPFSVYGGVNVKFSAAAAPVLVTKY
ncbi:TonB-dependent receptor [Methylopila sp. M107]|uniref:TonB-dependent receptor n=1 Tax=Methylopila sp. M107 TaxID=1101190 RepID=UPI0003A530A9|nr:TonB-dependent receptor [Methylopila sp. M107]